MQLLPKTRGQVSWSSNPLDDQLSTLESMGPMPAPGSSLAKPRSTAAALGASNFMPYSDSELLGDADIFHPVDRSIQFPNTSASGQRQQQIARQTGAGNSGRSAPQALRTAWATWFATHPAPHGHARAAASLRVKEAELLRALDGHGVQILQNDLAKLLAPAARWGRILVESLHPLGCAYLSMSPRQVRNDGGQVVLLEPNRQLLLADDAFAECFLIHGAGACGIHGFDENGEPVARLHLLGSSNGSLTDSIAMQHLLAHAIGAGLAPASGSRAVGNRLTRPGWCSIERQIHASEALAELCRRINLTLDDAPAMQFAMESEKAILACQATPLHKTGGHATLPLGLRDCKVHLRSMAVRHATICTGSDGRPFVRLHGLNGSCLRFQQAGSQLAAQAWIDSLLPSRG